MEPISLLSVTKTTTALSLNFKDTNWLIDEINVLDNFFFPQINLNCNASVKKYIKEYKNKKLDKKGEKAQNPFYSFIYIPKQKA